MTPKEAIETIRNTVMKFGRSNNKSRFYEALLMAFNALEKQIPKKPIHNHEEYEKHDWKTNPDGTVDDFAWDNDYHYGVTCKRCSEAVCVGCHDDYDEYAGKCVIDEYQCPNCKKHTYKNKFCPDCGQAIDWSETE